MIYLKTHITESIKLTSRDKVTSQEEAVNVVEIWKSLRQYHANGEMLWTRNRPNKIVQTTTISNVPILRRCWTNTEWWYGSLPWFRRQNVEENVIFLIFRTACYYCATVPNKHPCKLSLAPFISCGAQNFSASLVQLESLLDAFLAITLFLQYTNMVPIQ